ncbi:MAG: hypothetical protein ABW133_07790 [Polyangiaceae bacterium]
MTVPHAIGQRCAAWLVLALTAGCGAKTVSLGEWIPDRDAGPTVPDANISAPDALADGENTARAFYLEAESGRLSGGFTIGSDPSASAGAFLAPPNGVTSLDAPGAARALYTFDVADAGVYTIWGRIHSPDASHNTFWFQVDGGRWIIWRLATGDVWYWAPLHENLNYGTALTFDFAKGAHTLAVANSIEGNGLDRFYFTTGRETPPGNTTPCNPPHSIEKDGACIPSCGSQGGNSCIPSECQGRPTLPAHDCSVCCIVR